MKPIYHPKGAAAEYGEYALNIYTGCPHRCYYCFAPGVLRRQRESFHTFVEPRQGILPALVQQLERENITGKRIHLCFTCDPYPYAMEAEKTMITREIIRTLKAYGNHVQILTKGEGSRDFDLLDGQDWYGVTISCWDDMAQAAEPCALPPSMRMYALRAAKARGIRTWVSFEPVLDPDAVFNCILQFGDIMDQVKIGKLNYWPSDIDWVDFREKVTALCEKAGMDYTIKESLRKEYRRREDKPC